MQQCPDAHEPPGGTNAGYDPDGGAHDGGAHDGAGDREPGTNAKAFWDTRTTSQRLHDALREAMESLLSSGTLPRQGGLPATILVTIKLTDLEARVGFATTAHGGLVPTSEVIRHARKARIIDMVLDPHGNPLYLGRRRRLASDAIRHALTVRDRGCVRPGCTVPASRTEAHHLTDWAQGGRTDVDSMALLCPYDHDSITGWILYLKDGRVWCIPPPDSGLDPTPQSTTTSTTHRCLTRADRATT